MRVRERVNAWVVLCEVLQVWREEKKREKRRVIPFFLCIVCSSLDCGTKRKKASTKDEEGLDESATNRRRVDGWTRCDVRTK